MNPHTMADIPLTCCSIGISSQVVTINRQVTQLVECFKADISSIEVDVNSVPGIRCRDIIIVVGTGNGISGNADITRRGILHGNSNAGTSVIIHGVSVDIQAEIDTPQRCGVSRDQIDPDSIVRADRITGNITVE